MKNLKKIFGVIAVILALALIIGCGEPPPDSEDVITDSDSVVFEPVSAKRAVPIPSSNTPLNKFEPRVLGAYTEGTSNIYIIDVGQVRDIYVSTIARGHFNGTTPVSLTRTTVSTNTITNALTETISSSISKSDTWGIKSSVEASWKKSFPFVGEFSAKLSLEYNKSATTTNTSGRSTQTSESEAKSFADSLSIAFTIGNNGEPAGWHRYAMYAVADVYYVITTCLNNEELKGWETVVATRTNSFREHMEFCPNGNFDNSPIGEIIFPEDFWKDLEPPSNISPPIFVWPDNYFTDQVLIRTAQYTITNINTTRFHEPFDRVNFNVFGIDLNTMKQQGYKYINFYITMEARKNNSSTEQRFWLYHSTAHIPEPGELGKELFNLPTGTTWRSPEFEFANIPIDVFLFNEFILRYSAAGGNWNNQNVRVQLLFRKIVS
jgi:hypothetical protein